LLLNLEAVFTALLAWFVVRESTGPRVVVGLAAIVAGAIVLSWQGPMSVAGVTGPLAVAGACLLWAVDNNLTRKVALSDPLQVAMIKGLAAGVVNVALALAGGMSLPGVKVLVAAGIVGFFGYGLSLALFVLALRHVGAARTGAYFATAPFIGAAVSVAALGEPVTMALIAAGVLMALGTWFHLTERHEHEHVHEPLSHTHRHVHDEHHQHAHVSTDPTGEPHAHRHTHARLKHRHPHYPDAHHRHGHGTGGTA
jgi:drug/metabolite transporter (DMT)-like permease